MNGTWAIDYSIDFLCSIDGQGLYRCPDGRWCGAPHMHGLPNSVDNVQADPQINYGLTTFDNIIDAGITIFQCITLDNWNTILYNLMDSANTVFSVFYFVTLLLFNAFFMLNLILAVIMKAFELVELDFVKNDQNGTLTAKEVL